MRPPMIPVPVPVPVHVPVPAATLSQVSPVLPICSVLYSFGTFSERLCLWRSEQYSGDITMYLERGGALTSLSLP